MVHHGPLGRNATRNVRGQNAGWLVYGAAWRIGARKFLATSQHTKLCTFTMCNHMPLESYYIILYIYINILSVLHISSYIMYLHISTHLSYWVLLRLTALLRWFFHSPGKARGEAADRPHGLQPLAAHANQFGVRARRMASCRGNGWKTHGKTWRMAI